MPLWQKLQNIPEAKEPPAQCSPEPGGGGRCQSVCQCVRSAAVVRSVGVARFLIILFVVLFVHSVVHRSVPMFLRQRQRHQQR